MDMICTTQHKHGIMHKNEKQTCKTCIIGIILQKPTKPIHQTQENINKPYSNIIFSNLNKNTKSKKTRARNMKYFENKRKPIPFLENWWRIDEENEGFVSENGGFGKGEVDKTMNKHVMRGKTEKFFKTVLNLTLFVQNTHFSRLEWVVSNSPKSHVTNFEKFA